jgi:hypothetical protein
LTTPPTPQQLLDEFGCLLFECDGPREIGQIIKENGNAKCLYGIDLVVVGQPSLDEVRRYAARTGAELYPGWETHPYYYKVVAE